MIMAEYHIYEINETNILSQTVYIYTVYEKKILNRHTE